MAAIEVVTLGRLAVSVDGDEVRGISNRPVRAGFLVYLAVEGEVTRDATLACIWPHYPVDRARRALNQTLYQLRQDLGDDWLDTAGSYLRRTEDLRVDAARFADAMDAKAYERALELYGGPFLTSCHLVSSTEFEHWVDRQRGRLAALHRLAATSEIEKLLRTGGRGRALEVARGWVAMSPLEDEPRQYLIRLHERSGERGEALRQFDEFVSLLEAVGLEPLSETRILIQRVRDSSVPLAVSPAALAPDGREETGRRASGRRGGKPRVPFPVTVGMAAAVVLLGHGSAVEPTPDSGAEIRSATPPAPVDSEAYEVHLRGERLLHRLELGASIVLYDSAIALDSTFAEAYAGLAQANFLEGFFGTVSRPLAWPRAREGALLALERDSTLAAAHTVLGTIALYDDWDWDRAEAALTTALRLDRNDVLARHGYADLLTFHGLVAEGLSQVELARDAAPGSPLMNGTYVGHLYVARDYQRVLDEALPLREQVEDSSFLADFIASSLWELGRFDEAVDEYRRAWSADLELVDALERAFLRVGAVGAMRTAADYGAARWEPGDGSAYSIARRYARADAPDEAFLWLERAYEERRPQLLHFIAFPEFDGLRSDARYGELLERLGLVAQAPTKVGG